MSEPKINHARWSPSLVALSFLLAGCAPRPPAVAPPAGAPTFALPPTWTPTSSPLAAQEAAPLWTESAVPSSTTSPVVVTAVLPTPIPTSSVRDSAGMLAVCAQVHWGEPNHIFLVDPSGGPVASLTGSSEWDDCSYGHGLAWSPDGSRIAFESSPHNTQSTVTSLRTVNIDGTGLTDLSSALRVPPGQTTEYPMWSPDGSYLAFLSDENWVGGHKYLFVSSADGTSLRKLTSDPIYGYPVWSADGQSIYYVPDSGGDYALRSVSVESGVSSMVTELGGDPWPAWSPDRTRIALRGYESGIGIMDLLTQRAVRIEYPAPESDHGGNPPIYDIHSWSPAGDRLALTAYYWPGFTYLYVVEVGGGQPRRLAMTYIEGMKGAFAWLPTGREIAFVAASPCDGSGCRWDVYLVRVDGGSPYRLTNDGSVGGLASWSPDGRRIAYVSSSEEEGHDTLFVMDAAGSKPVEVLEAYGIWGVTWSPLE